LKVTEGQAVRARLVGGNRDIHFARLDGDIEFAGRRYANPEVGFIDPSTGFGNVGSRVLSDFVVSIDQSNELIRFRKVAQRPAADSGNAPRRLGVRFRGMPGGGALTVAGVEPGSTAEQAGLLPGDVLLTLNGKPAADYDMAALGALFRSSDPLRIEVDRDGDTQTVEIE
jgi:S1-C subfamily serine protease